MAHLRPVGPIKWWRTLIVVIAALGTVVLELSGSMGWYGVGCYNNLRSGSAMSSSQLESPDLGSWLLGIIGFTQEIGESKSWNLGFPDPWLSLTLGPSQPQEWNDWCSDKRMTNLEIHWAGVLLDFGVIGSVWFCLVYLLYFRRKVQQRINQEG